MTEKVDSNNKFNNKAIIFFVIFGLIILVLLINRIKTLPSFQREMPINQKLYSDPGNHFSITVPADWITTSDFGSQRTGIGSATEIKTRSEITNISMGNTGVNISVYEKSPDCSRIEKSNTTLAGIPAYYNPNRYTWTIYTNNSTIILGYYYPGLNVFHKKRRFMDIPKEEAEANFKKINEIVSTFKLQSDQVLQCP